MPTGRELVLGTLFKGTMDPSFTKAIAEMRNALGGLNDILRNIGNASSRATQRINALNNTISRAGSNIDKLNKKSMDPLNKQISKTKTGYERFLAAMKVTAAYGVAAGGMYKVLSALKAGVSEIIKYDQALKNLKAITSATDAQVRLMDETIRDVARSTKFSTVEVANGMTLLGQAGFTAEESMKAIHSTAMLATGTLTDFQTVTDLMTTTIRAFNLDAAESSRVADVMANAVNKSKLTIDKLRTSFNYVGATAAQAQLSIEQTAATMMVLANNGMRASTIGTGFRQVLSRMVAPSKAIREAMKEHNIELEKINPLTQGWEQALKNLTQVLYDSDRKTIDVSKAFELFGLRGAQAVSIIAKSFVSGDFQRALDNAYKVGSAEEMAAIQAEGLELKLKRLQDRAKLIAVAIGDAGATGAFRTFLDVLLAVVKGLETFTRTAVGSAVVNFLALTTAITGVGLALKGLWGVMKIAGIGSFFTNPILGAVAAVSALVAILYQLYKHFNGVADRAAKMASELRGTAQSIEVYRKSLEGLTKSQRDTAPKEYEALVKRLLKDHPELAKKIDVTKMSQEQLNNVLKQEELSKFHESLKKITETATINAKEVEKSADALKMQNITLTEMGDVFLDYNVGAKDAAEAQKKLNENIKKTEETGKNYVDILTDMVSAGLRSKEAAGAMLDTYIKFYVTSDKVADALKGKFKSAVDAIGQSAIDMNRRISELLQSLPFQYQRMYENLDALRQADLAKVISATNREIAAFEKAADQLGISGDKRAVAIEAIRQRELINFLEKKEEEVTGEEMTATRRMQIIEEFTTKMEDELKKQIDDYKEQRDLIVINQKATGDRLKEIDDLTNKKIQEANIVHQARMAAIDLLRNENLKAVEEERYQITLENYDKELEAKKFQLDRMQLEDELAVAKGEMTEIEALKRKMEREIQFLKDVLALRQQAVDESKRLYGVDSDNYKAALKEKIDAERKLELAELKNKVTLEDEKNKAEKAEEKAAEKANAAAEKAAEATEESSEKTLSNVVAVGAAYDNLSSYVSSNPLTIDADTDPAEAAFDALMGSYNTKIANMMVRYTQLVQQGMGKLANQVGWEIQKTIWDMKDAMSMWDNDPVLKRLGQQLGIDTSVVSKPTATSNAASSFGGSGSSMIADTILGSKTTPVETINLNIDTKQSNYGFEVVSTPTARDQIISFTKELERMGLSNG